MFARMILPAAALIASAAVNAKAGSSGESGFAISQEATVAARPGKVWAALVKPGTWWSSAHSWSGDAANMTLCAVPGGCFYERLPKGGFIDHAQVIFARPGELLGLSGAPGPLQGEGLSGTLNIALKPAAEGRTVIRFEYVVGGYARFPLAPFAGAVDEVLGDQQRRLVTLIEPDDPIRASLVTLKPIRPDKEQWPQACGQRQPPLILPLT